MSLFYSDFEEDGIPLAFADDDEIADDDTGDGKYDGGTDEAEP